MMSDEFEYDEKIPDVLLDRIEDAEEEELEETDDPCASCNDDDDVRLVNDEPLCAACRIATGAIDADEESDSEVDSSRLD